MRNLTFESQLLEGHLHTSTRNLVIQIIFSWYLYKIKKVENIKQFYKLKMRKLFRTRSQIKMRRSKTLNSKHSKSLTNKTKLGDTEKSKIWQKKTFDFIFFMLKLKMTWTVLRRPSLSWTWTEMVCCHKTRFLTSFPRRIWRRCSMRWMETEMVRLITAWVKLSKNEIISD